MSAAAAWCDAHADTAAACGCDSTPPPSDSTRRTPDHAPAPHDSTLSTLSTPSDPSGPRLPATFWLASPVLARIRDHARSRILAPDALLACVLVEVAAHTAPEITIPPVVGAPSSLNLFVVLSGPSGAGKSAVASAAALFAQPNAVPDNDDDPVRCGLGSGEGLTALFVDDKGNRTATAAVAHVDEVSSFARLTERQGSTLDGVLRSAWSGARLGTRNRRAETSHHVEPHTYRLVVVFGAQPLLAAPLLDRDGGTAQRMVWFATDDPDADADAGDASTSSGIVWTPPSTRAAVTVSATIAREIRARAVEARRTGTTGHDDLSRLRVAALLAILHDAGAVVDEPWWTLAGAILDTSDRIVSDVRSTARRAARERAITAGVARAAVDDEIDAAREERAHAAARVAVLRFLAARPGAVLTARDVRLGITARHRPHVAAALDALTRDGSVIARPATGENGHPVTAYQTA